MNEAVPPRSILPGLDVDHPLFDLQSLAALALGRCRVLATASSADDAASRLAKIREHLGLLSHAELVESDDDRYVAATAGPASLTSALALTRDLSRLGGAYRMICAEPLPWTIAVDEGRVRSERLSHRGLSADRWFLVDDDEEVPVEIDAFRPADPDVVELIQELRAALEADPDAPQLDADAAQVVVVRRSGRVGVHLRLRGPPTPAAAARAWRHLVDTIFGRVGHVNLRLAPDANWRARLGPEFTLWLVAAPAPGLPTPPTSPWGHRAPATPLVSCTALWLDVDTDEAIALAEALDLTAPGVYLAPPAHTLTPAGRESAQRLLVPGSTVQVPTVAHLATPHALLGLEAEAADVDLHCWVRPGLTLVRARHGVRDRDLRETAHARPPTDDDRALAAWLTDRLGAARIETAPGAGDRWFEPVVDGQDRRGARLQLDLRQLRKDAAVTALADACDPPPDRVEPLITLAFGRTSAWVCLWYRAPGEAVSGPRPWEVAP